MTVIDQIINTIPIIDSLERYAGANFIKARTSRRRFNIRCPFHNDKNPSFTVYSDTNTFRCWSGCNDGKPGNVINIVKISQNVETKEAIKKIISDYGLKQPDSAQAKEWQKKRVERESSAALRKGLNKKIIECINALKKVDEKVNAILSTIKTIEDLERVGSLYHVIPQVNYWMDCLIENDPVVQFQAIQEVSRFLEKINRKEGESA